MKRGEAIGLTLAILVLFGVLAFNVLSPPH